MSLNNENPKNKMAYKQSGIIKKQKVKKKAQMDKFDTKNIKGLIKSLKKSDSASRVPLKNVLVAFGETAVEPLLKVLKDKDKIIASEVAEILGLNKS